MIDLYTLSRPRIRYGIFDARFFRVKTAVGSTLDGRNLVSATIFISLLTLWPVSAHAQLPDSLSNETQVSLITIYPGNAIYSAFGHSALRFYDPGYGYDMAFNYGTFDSSDPFFIPRFTNGQLDYQLSVGSMRRLIAGAEIEQRSVVEQTLQLSSPGVADLYRTLRINSFPENRIYRYDFLFENCATILLDRIQQAGGGSVRLDSTGVQSESFRELLQPYLNDRPLYDLGIAIVLGSTIDHKATYGERSFLPLELMSAIGGASILNRATDNDSENRSPLVISVDTLLWIQGTGLARSRDLSLMWLFSAIGFIWILSSEMRRRKKGKSSLTRLQNATSGTGNHIADRLLFGVSGFAGLILSFVWFISAHTVGAANWNLVWALPSHVVIAALWHRIPVQWKRVYFGLSGILAFGLLIGQPILVQKLHPALIPVVIVIGWRSISLFFYPTQAPEAQSV